MPISASNNKAGSANTIFERINDIVHVLFGHIREKRKRKYSFIDLFRYGKISPFIMKSILIERLKMSGNKMDAGADISLI
jgi:hypothetical protein